MRYTVQDLLRTDIKNLVPYSSARNEYDGDAKVFLDANENWQNFVGKHNYHRYPDPLQRSLKEKIGKVFGFRSEQLVIGNGSDEIIDLLFRIFCTPYKDKTLILSPTYGAYKVFADINAVSVSSCQLKDDFMIDFHKLETICHLINTGSPETGMHKLLFICSPNNPSGTVIPLSDIAKIAGHFEGITVVDEAYHDYSKEVSAVTLMNEFPKLVVLRTMSKAWGLAGVRIGMAVAQREVVDAMNKVKYPYNLSIVAQESAMEALDHVDRVRAEVAKTLAEREKLAQQLTRFSFVEEIIPSQANFLLVRVRDADGFYYFLRDMGIIIRNRSTLQGCYGCVRVTIGSPEENESFLDACRQWEAVS
ncbi:MAG: histidinol-phosphate transaminase [Spirochaetales bacterium]|nr:histidinol-phosphate transaminase [Spirochaetales bacterium]